MWCITARANPNLCGLKRHGLWSLIQLRRDNMQSSILCWLWGSALLSLYYNVYVAGKNHIPLPHRSRLTYTCSLWLFCTGITQSVASWCLWRPSVQEIWFLIGCNLQKIVCLFTGRRYSQNISSLLKMCLKILFLWQWFLECGPYMYRATPFKYCDSTCNNPPPPPISPKLAIMWHCWNVPGTSTIHVGSEDL